MTSPAGPSRRGEWRWLIGVLLVLTTLDASIPAAQAGIPPPGKTVLAVLPFTGPADLDGYGHVLAQALRDGLRQVRAVTALKAGQIETSCEHLGLSLTETLSDEGLLALARDLHVRGLVAGSYVTDGDTVTVRARFVDTAGPGLVEQGEAVSGPVTAYLLAPQRILATALQRFQLPLTAMEERRVRQAFDGPHTTLGPYALYARAGWEQGRGSADAQVQAVALLTAAHEADALFALAPLALGRLLLATNEPWRAWAALDDALAIDPRLSEAHKLRGDVLAIMPTRPHAQALRAYTMALELAPDYAEARVAMGDVRHAMGQTEEAITAYEQALRLDPSSARAHQGLGKIYADEDSLYHEAVAEFRQAVALDPGLLEAHLSLGDLYEEKGLSREAIERYRDVLALAPRHPGAAYALARASEKLDVSMAIARWEEYLRLASTLPAEVGWMEIARKHLDKLRRGGSPTPRASP